MSYGDDALQSYVRQIRQHPLLTQEEESKLAGEALAGNEDARDKLVCCNLRLVLKIAHDFKGYGLPLMDLVGEGNIGLMRAVQTFDPAKGAKLSTYASWWIKRAMRGGVANHGHTVRVPIQTAARMNKVSAACAQFALRHGREPTHSEVAEETDLPERAVVRLRQGRPKVTSLNEPIQREGGNGEQLDLMADAQAAGHDEALQHGEMIGRLVTLLCRLDERERTIISLRFGLDGDRPRTLNTVSETMQRTRERVRQIQAGAIAKLRAMMNAEGNL